MLKKKKIFFILNLSSIGGIIHNSINMPQFNPVLLSFDTKLYLFYTGSNILVAFPLNNIIEQVKEERHERHKEGAVSC